METVRRRAHFIDIGYTIKKDKTYIWFIVKGKKTTKLYYQHDPYFLIDGPVERKDDFLNIEVPRKDGTMASPVHVEEIERKMGQTKKKMIKLYCARPSDVPLIKQAIPFPCFEYSIPFVRRFMFDMQLSPFYVMSYDRKGQMITKINSITEPKNPPELSMLAFDIETYNPQGIPRENKDPVIMISYSGNKKGVLTFKKSKMDFVETLKGERELLERFFEVVQQENPDVIFGYNSASFDLPYLKERSKMNNIILKMGRFGGSVRPLMRGMIKGCEIRGRVHFDLYPIARLFGFIGVIKAQKFTLDAVAEEMLGKKKVEINSKEMWKVWDSNDIDKLCEYSLVDSELALGIGKLFLPLEMEMSIVAKMPLFQTTMATSGQLVENLLMYAATEKNHLIPRKPKGESINERLNAPIQGAFVKLPEPGIYDNVTVLDFRGLYPSIIISYNIDPNTLMEDENESIDCFVSPSGARFSKKERGLVPEVLEYLVSKRGELKDMLKKTDKSSDEYVRLAARSQALKILGNSFYGYLGYARSRWYSRPCAESVTAWGRKHIMETIERAEASGFQVLYADTDSVFLIYNDKKKVIEFMKEVNANLPGMMELELEGFYPRGVFVSKKGGGERGAKKKYALLGEDGRIKIKGFELVRRDWSEVAKETQRMVLEAILKDGSKEKAVKIIRDVIIRIQSGKVPLQSLAISTQLNKDPGTYEIKSPELSAAKKLIQAGTPVEKGTMISYVIGKKGKSISEKAVPLELATEYDVEYYIDHQILPAVMKIMKELGYDEYSMKQGGKQQSLGEFF
ncbi:DNA-directed DNA polymerase [Candidatus Micrarchaeota archaeon]|nr:DNA-directed DNA polymerase [Candidatus Micrarchaeota archaeon]MBU1166153.1 DNA-directed DNA polymerase [Candidatus Micrarchaeota archaeon]MBU1887303.1 DNA-directed DNA polymerase [Candidatus Micrarchaeota archaeon]